ncbi:MAG: Re/Si-specific NAD(P)(+) transhydrogenase subunit alpha [Gammaproteobacteria bacterium]
MKVGIPKEIVASEQRVAAVPETVAKIKKLGFDILVESGAGLNAHIADSEYQTAGAILKPSAEDLYTDADIILKVQRPSESTEMDFMKEKSVLIGYLSLAKSPALIEKLNQKKITAFSLEYLPRIARAQSMDILSSMSNIAGYKSVIIAANYLGKFFPMLMTAAGTIPPAKVMVIGAGVAGLQAIATARRLGGVVTAFDTRPIAGEQVKSLGADFVSLEVPHDQAEDNSGYAKEQSAEFYSHEQNIIRDHLKNMDVVITTALIPGKRAPLLITEDMVKDMKPGAVIVDLASEQEGNCALTMPGKTIVKYGVTLVGELNIPSTVPIHASQLYARNLFNFLNSIVQDAKIKIDFSDEIIKGCLITHDGETVHSAFKRSAELRG